MKGLYDYIERKVYNSWFGDIVPTFTANALDIDIIVIEKRNNGFECYSVGKIANNPNSIPLLLLKIGQHYDGLANMRNQGYGRHVVEYVTSGNACTVDEQTGLATDDVYDDISPTYRAPSCQLQQMPTSNYDVIHESTTHSHVYNRNAHSLQIGHCDIYSPDVMLCEKSPVPSYSGHCLKFISWNINGLTDEKWIIW